MILGSFTALRTPKADGAGLADAAQVCQCNNVSKGALCERVRCGDTTLGALRESTRAGSTCGGCVPLVPLILEAELAASGAEVSDDLCEHFAHTRQELFHLVRLHEIRTFEELIERHGCGLGCEICKPAVTSILAACWNEHILDPVHAGLQDSNDHFLANIRRDGSYSVVPRVPGGEITPDKLIAIGTELGYNLYCVRQRRNEAAPVRCPRASAGGVPHGGARRPGATFAVVPFVKPRALGSVAGIVGAGGNAGAVGVGFLFRVEGMQTSTALLCLGVAVTLASAMALAVRFDPADEGAHDAGFHSVAQRDPMLQSFL